MKVTKNKVELIYTGMGEPLYVKVLKKETPWRTPYVTFAVSGVGGWSGGGSMSAASFPFYNSSGTYNMTGGGGGGRWV